MVWYLLPGGLISCSNTTYSGPLYTWMVIVNQSTILRCRCHANDNQIAWMALPVCPDDRHRMHVRGIHLLGDQGRGHCCSFLAKRPTHGRTVRGRKYYLWIWLAVIVVYDLMSFLWHSPLQRESFVLNISVELFYDCNTTYSPLVFKIITNKTTQK